MLDYLMYIYLSLGSFSAFLCTQNDIKIYANVNEGIFVIYFFLGGGKNKGEQFKTIMLKHLFTIAHL